MKYKIMATGRFKKDLKILIKRGYDMKLMDNIVKKLANNEDLPAKNKDHSLSGNYAGLRECHIEYYVENVPLFRRNRYRKSGAMILRVRSRDTTLNCLLSASLLA